MRVVTLLWSERMPAHQRHECLRQRQRSVRDNRQHMPLGDHRRGAFRQASESWKVRVRYPTLVRDKRCVRMRRASRAHCTHRICINPMHGLCLCH